jgi:hypothetical protein
VNHLASDELALRVCSLTLWCRVFAVIGGLQETIRLCKDCHDPRVLRALIKIVVTMVPYPDELVVSKGWWLLWLRVVACVTQELRSKRGNVLCSMWHERVLC